MKRDNTILQIVKVPLSKRSSDYKASFKPNDMLYLEYLENKLKIKPELRNKNYVSKMNINLTEKKILDITDPPNFQYKSFINDMNIKDKVDRERDIRDFNKHDSPRNKSKSRSRSRSRDKSRGSHTSGSRLMRKLRREERRRRRRDERTREGGSRRDERTREGGSRRDGSRRDERTRDGSRRSSKHSSKGSKHGSRNERNRDERTRDDDKMRDENDRNRDERQRDETRGLEHQRDENKSNEHKTELDKLLLGDETKDSKIPSLNEIESKEIKTINVDGTNVRDISHITSNEELDNNKKRDIMYKFEVLKRRYPEGKIPEFSEYTDLKTLQQCYDDTMKRLNLDSTIENYKQYLTWGFYGTEWILTKFLNFNDIQGFAMEQITGMNKYESLLVELGEKNNTSGFFANLPIEVRLLGTIVMNALVFILTKKMMSKVMSGFNTAPTSQPPKKNKMKGPNIEDMKKNL